MSSQICLKWNSFLSNIATSFESLWEEEGLVDVTLASDGQCLTAHKVILSASSPFFKKVFQTNPCQHPVVILQDVHFTELEALLIFIYKGEVNIEQKNLPALLKAAETLQIRGLSGGDIFANESYKRLTESEQSIGEEENSDQAQDEAPKKKQKVTKAQNNSILEKALTPRASRSASASESSGSDPYPKDEDELHLDDPNRVLNPVYHRLDMKIEPFEVNVDDLQKHPEVKEELQRLDADQADGMPVNRTIASSSKSAVKVIAEARHIRSPSRQEPAIEPKVSMAESHELPRDISERPSSLHPSDGEDSNERESRSDCPQSLSFPSDCNPGMSHSAFPPLSSPGNSDFSEESQATTTATKGGPVYPPFPCPFCDRAYASWGFRRRHIKAVHTISPKLNCKWCLQVLPTHAAWRRHVISAHNLSASDAHNGLLILEEAHMVLQIAHPTRLDTLVNIIKQSSQQNSAISDSAPQPD